MRARRIIVGLGNPGDRYRDTRHNVGFWFVDYLSHRWDFPFFRVVEDILMSKGRACGADVVLLKPATYMNRSGLALATLSRVHAFRPADLLVCHDDLDIPVGRFKLRSSGGAGGHKGVRSILDYVGGEGVARLKFGIQPREKPGDVEAFVLEPFEADEDASITDLFPRAQEAVECLIAEGIDKAMSLYNRNDRDSIDQEV